MNFMDTLRKSQMNLFDWAETRPQPQPQPHHVGYNRTDPRTGSVQTIQPRNPRPERKVSEQTKLRNLKRDAEMIARRNGHELEWRTYTGEESSSNLVAYGTCRHCRNYTIRVETNPTTAHTPEFLAANPHFAKNMRMLSGSMDKQCRQIPGGTLPAEWQPAATMEEATERFKQCFGATGVGWLHYDDAGSARIANILGEDLHRIATRYPAMKQMIESTTGSGIFQKISFVNNATVSHRPGKTCAGYWQGQNITIAAKADAPAEQYLHVGEYCTSGQVQSIMRHEIGHQLYKKLLTRGQRQKWGAICTALKKAGMRNGISTYGSTKNEEGFCEWLTIYTNPHFTPEAHMAAWKAAYIRRIGGTTQYFVKQDGQTKAFTRRREADRFAEENRLPDSAVQMVYATPDGESIDAKFQARKYPETQKAMINFMREVLREDQ